MPCRDRKNALHPKNVWFITKKSAAFKTTWIIVVLKTTFFEEENAVIRDKFLCSTFSENEKTDNETVRGKKIVVSTRMFYKKHERLENKISKNKEISDVYNFLRVFSKQILGITRVTNRAHNLEINPQD